MNNKNMIIRECEHMNKTRQENMDRFPVMSSLILFREICLFREKWQEIVI